MPTTNPSTDRSAISQIIDGLLAAGCTPTVARDGENDDLPWKGNTKTAILDHLTSCEESVLFVDLPEGAERKSTHVYFVLGNEPFEVASNYGVALSPYIEPITDEWPG